MIVKKCLKCNEQKQEDLFTKSKGKFINVCKSCRKEQNKQWYEANKERISEDNKIKYTANRESICEKNKRWHKENDHKRKEVKNKNYRDFYKRKYNKDFNFTAIKKIRRRLRTLLKLKVNKEDFILYLGCSLKELERHIESQFQPGMTWDNWSINGWHLDHIIPLSSFNLSDPEQLKIACHYTNLQPLWAADNIRKRNNLPQHQVI